MIGTGAALLGSAIIGGGASLLGGATSSKAATSAANVQAQAARESALQQRQMFDQMRGDLRPYMDVGAGALNKMAGLYGIGNGGRADFSDFTASPDYQFALDQGNKMLNRTAAAKGQLVSGNALLAAQKFGQGLATQQYGNYFSRLSGMAGMGQNAAAGVGAAGIQTGRGIGEAITGAGQATASGIVGSANAWGGALNSIGGMPNSMLQNYTLMNYLNRGSGSAYGSNGMGWAPGPNGGDISPMFS